MVSFSPLPSGIVEGERLHHRHQLVEGVRHLQAQLVQPVLAQQQHLMGAMAVLRHQQTVLLSLVGGERVERPFPGDLVEELTLVGVVLGHQIVERTQQPVVRPLRHLFVGDREHVRDVAGGDHDVLLLREGLLRDQQPGDVDVGQPLRNDAGPRIVVHVHFRGQRPTVVGLHEPQRELPVGSHAALLGGTRPQQRRGQQDHAQRGQDLRTGLASHDLPSMLRSTTPSGRRQMSTRRHRLLP